MARIQAKLNATGRPPVSLVLGIGDDAAVVAPTRNAQVVLTTDAQVEGVHFERAFSAPADIGHRALAVNLSDLAAMGAIPRWALLSLVLPGALRVDDLETMIGGVAELAASAGVHVLGGNITRTSGPLVLDITAIGEARPRRILTRSGGRPGDLLYLSGSVGGAAAGLEMLKAGRAADMDVECVRRHQRPSPRVRLGQAVANARAARAAMDLSDGLGDAAHQLAVASGCGVEIDGDAVPVEPAARAWWQAAGQDVIRRAIQGGDDYELLFAVPRSWSGRLRHARSRVAEPALTRIGVLTKDPGAWLLRRDGAREPLPEGFQHFAGTPD